MLKTCWNGVSLNKYIFSSSMKPFAYKVFDILYCWQGYPKKGEEINLMIYFIFKILRDQLLLLETGHNICMHMYCAYVQYLSAVYDQEATPDHKMSVIFFF